MIGKNLKNFTKMFVFLTIIGSLGISLAGCVYYPDRGYGGYYAAPAYGYVPGGDGGYRHHEDDDDD